MCGHPRVEDTSIVQHCLDNDADMVDVPMGSVVAQLEDLTRFEFALWNASLDGCKESL